MFGRKKDDNSRQEDHQFSAVVINSRWIKPEDEKLFNENYIQVGVQNGVAVYQKRPERKNWLGLIYFD